jgi:ribokinase
VQDATGIPLEIASLERTRHGAEQQVSRGEVGLDRADSRRAVGPQRPEHGHPRRLEAALGGLRERRCLSLELTPEHARRPEYPYARPVPPALTVVGSINLDLVATVERLPRAGETLSGATLAHIPGGKGANQAVAAAKLGAGVRMVGCVGRDAYADEALVGLREAAVQLDVREVDAPTGIAIILVAADGENQIVVVPGANADVGGFSVSANVLSQLEIPDDALREARAQAEWLCVNAAPARPLVVDPDLVVANRYEAEVIGEQHLLVVTLGEEGALLLEDGKEIARARAPRVNAVDGTAAGDAFTACLVVSLLEGREREEALRRACAAGAVAASRFGAQPSLPTADEVDAILRA